MIGRSLTPRLRCEAELDPGFKQIIPYLILEHNPTGRVFAMTRVDGDERLRGRISLGLGGHIDKGKTSKPRSAASWPRRSD